MMNQRAMQPRPSGDGVLFTLMIDSQKWECNISKQSLDKMCEERSIDSTDADALDVFHAFENTIGSLACNFIRAKVSNLCLSLKQIEIREPFLVQAHA